MRTYFFACLVQYHFGSSVCFVAVFIQLSDLFFFHFQSLQYRSKVIFGFSLYKHIYFFNDFLIDSFITKNLLRSNKTININPWLWDQKVPRVKIILLTLIVVTEGLRTINVFSFISQINIEYLVQLEIIKVFISDLLNVKMITF